MAKDNIWPRKPEIKYIFKVYNALQSTMHYSLQSITVLIWPMSFSTTTVITFFEIGVYKFTV
jgi:hypothetical protein